ncbi:MAG: YihY/virulence factor BrkB family protein [Flavobacteriales bacterium]|nr:YihY/virulence factor BrkB family protein [Flavobacteriales bacterium]
MTKLKELLLVQKLAAISDKIIIPGFQGVSLFYIIKFLIKGLQENPVTTRASALSFHFFIALFPTVIFIFTVIPYIPIDNFQEQLLLQLEILLPTDAYELTRTTIEDIIGQPRGGLLSFGFITALLFATNGVNAIMQAFNESYFIEKKRNFFKQRLVALVLTLVLVIVMLTTVGVYILNTFFMDYLSSVNVSENMLLFWSNFSRFIILPGMFYFSTSFIYFSAPMANTKWNLFSAGSTLATIIMLAASFGFAAYINNFGQYNKLYGSIGTLIVIMLWIYINSLILLLGFELNAVINKQSNRIS